MINLYDNHISSLEQGDLNGLGNLITLILSANTITTIQSGAFDGLGNLQQLYLGYNLIPTLPQSIAELTSINN